MENAQVKEGRRKIKRIGKKVGNVVVIMQAISVVFAVLICVYMYNSLVRSMQEKICTNGTNLLAYELSRVSEGDDMNQVLDDLKKRQGCEFTIFEGDTRAYSTVVKNGERVVGTKLASNLIDVVLEQGQSYVGEADILGETYLCSYVPTKGAGGQIDGLIFAGISIAEAEEETARIITYATIISVAVIIGCILFLTVYLKKRVSNPLGRITEAAV
ncbi:MAG: cache domain-containing protein, partial [Lachnospiraceae bacterium]|nr:cache domain-containing protein [Lachnospiraceae bacterium]